MKHEQMVIKKTLTESDLSKIASIQPQLVLVFGAVENFAEPNFGGILAKAVPGATIIGCSARGEISKKGVTENTTVITGIHFDKKVNIFTASAKIDKMEDSRAVGERIAKTLQEQKPKSVFVLGQGVNINGSQMVEGMKAILKNSEILTGGLAGDGAEFKKTYTILNQNVSDQNIVAIGLSGDIHIGFGSMGGWKPFGPVRKVTRSNANLLMEIDGEPALNVYKKYLGDQAKNLPSSGLLYPFALLNSKNDETGLIRTILGIDEKLGTLTLAGDLPENSLVRLMHTDNDGLIEGAQGAANSIFKLIKKGSPGVAILISCIGRKLVMGGQIDGEVEAVQDIIGDQSVVTGFYSHGEIAPSGELSLCNLHNQTMTITYLTE